MKKTIVIGLVLAMGLFATGIFAQKAHRMNQGMKNMNPEMKSYFEENILPVMKVQRVELDKELSGSEKTRLDEMRSDLKIMRQQKIEKMKEMRDLEEKPSVEQRQEMREMRNQMNDMMDEVAVMAENHDVTITRLLSEVDTEIEQWRQDVRGMMEKNRADCMRGDGSQNPGMGNRGNQGMGNRCNPGMGNRGNPEMGNRGNSGMYNGEGMPMRRLLNPQTFLLWNPDEPMPFFDDKATLEDNLKLNIYPNPASGKVQISLQLEEEAIIGFSIFNKDGNEVMTIGQENVAAGLYSKTIDAGELTDGLYIIKVSVGEKSSIGRFIVQH